MVKRLREWFSRPVRQSGRDYLRAVQRHWIPLVLAVLAFVGGTQVVFAVALPYWAWLLIGFTLLSWAQFLAFHDMREARNELAEELRIGHEVRGTLEATAVGLKERVRQRDLLVQVDHELRLAETLHHRTSANPVHPLTLQHVREILDGADYRIRMYLTPTHPDVAERFLAITVPETSPALLPILHAKRRVLEEFIHDPEFFPDEPRPQREQPAPAQEPS